MLEQAFVRLSNCPEHKATLTVKVSEQDGTVCGGKFKHLPRRDEILYTQSYIVECILENDVIEKDALDSLLRTSIDVHRE